MSNAKSSAEWIDILKPNSRELELLRKRFHLHPVIVNELKGPSARAKVEAYDNYLYLIYYFPVFDEREEISVRTEIDFIITKSAIITVHYQKLEALVDFKPKVGDNSLRLTYGLIEALLNFQERQLRHIREKVEAVGKEIFKEKEQQVLEKISKIKRDVSEYRIVARHEEPILKSLVEKGKEFWGLSSQPYLNDLIGDHLKLMDQLDSYREATNDFEDTNNQLMNLKINRVMKTFTTLSFLTFPFMLLATIFNMNVGGLPFQGNPDGFWIILAAMATAMISLTVYFKKKGWF